MKTNMKQVRTMRLAVLLLGLAGSWGIGVVNAKAELQFTAGLEIRAAGDFYAPLTPYGFWVKVGPYGRCWHPASVEPDWRPYCSGHWEWTDCGWYWVSDEPWAWACYHYGSWVSDPTYGWLWIPGTEWAPAWVTWREAPDYVGWAPCGPRGVVLAPSFFVFVDVHHFHDRIQPGSVIVNNTTIINRTKVVSGFTRERRSLGDAAQTVVVNRGPSVDLIQRATGTKFSPRPVREVVSQTPVPREVRRDLSGPVRIERPVQEPPRERIGREQPRERTGREQPRVYQQPPAAQPRQRWEQPPPVVPPERTPPPTARDRGNERFEGQGLRKGEALPAPHRPEREAPGRPAGPPPGQERPRDKDDH